MESAAGVDAIAGTDPSWHQSLFAACVWAGAGSAASHRSAAAQWKLDGFNEDVVEISTTHRMRSSKVVVHRRRSLDRRETTTLNNIPTMRVDRRSSWKAGLSFASRDC